MGCATGCMSMIGPTDHFRFQGLPCRDFRPDDPDRINYTYYETTYISGLADYFLFTMASTPQFGYMRLFAVLGRDLGEQGIICDSFENGTFWNNIAAGRYEFAGGLRHPR